MSEYSCIHSDVGLIPWEITDLSIPIFLLATWLMGVKLNKSSRIDASRSRYAVSGDEGRTLVAPASIVASRLGEKGN